MGAFRLCIAKRAIVPPLFEKCAYLGKHRHMLTRETLEAKAIADLGDTCVSKLSVALEPKELEFLRSNQ